MKKWSGLILLSMVLFMTGCGDKNPGADTEGTSGQGTKTESQTKSQTKGYVFEYNNVSISIDALAEPVLAGMGEPVSYFEAASCAFEGLDKMYTFGSVEVDTYPSEEGDRISAVLFKDDMVKTAEGVSLFMSKADMTAAYGENYTEENGKYVYEKDGMKLCFILEADEIVSIEYLTKVLD